MGDEDPFSYSAIEIPTVVGLLRNVLTQYPDNGQILKELVQNAEDAGATLFEVVHDARSISVGKETVKRFVEGPALFIHNDAEFTKEDWHGIRMLSDSIKRDDLLKVGQFGLGFKSVFHITDYVTIISGGNVLFMDPNEPEARMCRDIPLGNLCSVIPESECLALWGIYLQREHLRNGHFPGTLFWFPLRKKESKLSSNIYGLSNVERLFQSFSVEAPLCLTFLKSLESIFIVKMSENGRKTDILKINLRNTSSLGIARRERQTFRSELQACNGFPSRHLTFKYDITVDTNSCGSVSSQRFRIIQYLPSIPKSSEKSHMPLVGIAAPIPSVRSDSQGKIFCFLPLPLEDANNTNLPVQINGYFVLDQNRRHVKWRTEESSTEADVIWNENLVRDVLADAYYDLLKDLCDEARAGSISLEEWYGLLPNTAAHAMSGRWRDLSIKTWKKLVELPIIYSEVTRMMMKPREVFSLANLSSWQCDISKSVKQVLDDVGLPIARIPESIEATLREMGAAPQQVTPRQLRECLKNNPINNTWNRQHLLKYVLSDQQYRDLEGIELLPLENNTWRKFCVYGPMVYVCGEPEVSAFVGNEDKLLRNNLDIDILHQLREAAARGDTSLRLFDPELHTTELLPVSVAYIRIHSYNHKQLERWLQSVWSLLERVRNLKPVEHLSLIPSSDILTAQTLVDLSSPIIVKTYSVPDAFIEALKLLEIKVLNSWPYYMRHRDIGQYYNGIDVRGVLVAIEKMLRHQNAGSVALAFNGRHTQEQRKEFCNQLSSISHVPPVVENFLRKLCVFKAVGWSGETNVCVDNVCRIYPSVSNFPVRISEFLIYPINESMKNFALKLGAVQLTKEDLCIMALQNQHSDQDLEKLGWYILCDYELSQSEKIRTALRDVRFISSVSGKLCMPSELYDPCDNDIDALLGEGMIPSQRYKQYNNLLKYLGLKTVCHMSREELIRIIRGISSSSFKEHDREVKIRSLLRIINNRSDCAEICQIIRNVICIKGVVTVPSDYPSNLEWATKNKLYMPCEVKSFHLFRNVVGSVIPLVDSSNIPKVAQYFGWDQDPNIDFIKRHFKNVVNICQGPRNLPGTPHYDHIKQIYQMLQKYVGTQEESLLPLKQEAFVFTGSGFRFPSEVYLPSGEEDLPLLPYMDSPPLELCGYRNLFCALGAFEKQSLPLFYRVLREIQSNHNSCSTLDTHHDLGLVVSVLIRMAKYKDNIDHDHLLLPVETARKQLELVKLSECAYSDQDCDWLEGGQIGVRVIHKYVGITLAKSLGVEPLNRHLLADEEALIEWGQHEPLTTRIHNLLRQYRDGVAVLKELVQNADDAGATQICFLYDERQNLDSRKRLISDSLKEFQGPALWAYNNAVFTENDFKNLCKLGGATKEHFNTKIGKFGLGFCSVYNITDVPSFVSGNSYVIFDPHSVHLGGKKEGGRYDFTKERNKKMLNLLNGQFQPFYGVFDCHIQEKNKFDGTLFRLPLRTSTQASESMLSDQSYSHNDVVELLSMFREIIGEILLFTQNVQEIKVFHVGKDRLPQNMELLYESCRKKNNCRSLQMSMDNSQGKPVERAARLYDFNHKWNGEVFSESTVTDIEVTCSGRGARMVNGKEGTKSVTWITSWHSGNGESCKLAERYEGKVSSLACVALPVEREKNSWKPRKLKNLPDGFYKESHMHCFLPLPVKTQLPLQVNGFFEVASDRTSLITSTEDDRNTSNNWNKTLMKDAVSSSYINLLLFLKGEGLYQDTQYFSLWPVINENSDELLLQLANAFYATVTSKDLDVFRNKYGWHPMSKCVFLAEKLYKCDLGSVVLEFMGNLLRSSQKEVMEFPQKMLASFGTKVMDSLVDEVTFYTKCFLPNLTNNFLDQKKQNKLILHIIDTQKSFLNELKYICCIPTKPNGKLRKPGDLVNPESDVASLFSIFDERFPLDEFMKGSRANILSQLGMCSSKLHENMLKERAVSVDAVTCFQCAKERSSEILHYMQTHFSQTDKISCLINDVSFIPVENKPQGWLLSWKGDECPSKTYTSCPDHKKSSKSSIFIAPKAVCSPSLLGIAGSIHFIHSYDADSKYSYPVEVCKKLGIITQGTALPFHSIVSQLTEYRLHFQDFQFPELEKICAEMYKSLDYQARENELVLSDMENEKILLTKYGFVEPLYFAVDGDCNCSPALFFVEREGLGKYRSLIKSLGINQHFPFHLVQDKLLQMNHNVENKVTEEEVLLISNLLNLLFQSKEKEGNASVSADLCLPDSQRIMRPLKDLCVDDGSLQGGKKFYFLHGKLHYSQEMLKWLGIEEKIKKRFKDLSHRLQFGQKEPLTTRLRNILDNYPFDTGIMKELLQNADDAGATEISFIKDNRYLPKETLFDEKWADLQGPALCVYNNRGFTMKDLEGIQNLGNSTKIDDPASTGQYGIGFNAVYHLTDAPSFLTRGSEISIDCDKNIPENETLCMFDPHCIYDPQATAEYPGVQLKDLVYLRETYPDSFKGYMEELVKEEGTVFRLPLRTYEESKLGKVVSVRKVEQLLNDFKSEMKIALLFLRNIRRISIRKVDANGKMTLEYSVELKAEDEKMLQLADLVKNRKSEYGIDKFFFNMQRLSYKVLITDSNKEEYQWLVTHQFGAEVNSLPELVSEAFHGKNLRLLPQGGVAVLLRNNSRVKTDFFKNFCYLPLPTQSGFMMCLNGHFALDNSRRDLWIGKCDFKAEWNKWLMGQVLAPVIAEAIYEYRNLLFPSKEELLLTDYKRKISYFSNILPTCHTASSEKWKALVSWTYHYVKTHKLPIFDNFIPEKDEVPETSSCYGYNIGNYISQRGGKPLKGKLNWHALEEDSAAFPMYFCKGKIEDPLLNTLKRLGMKIGSDQFYHILLEAGVDIEIVTPEKVLTFLLSWDKDFRDVCQPRLLSEIKSTPFICVENVCILLKYISSVDGVCDRFNNVPLLVCSDNILRHFDSDNKVFCTKYGNLMPQFQHEFIDKKLYGILKSLKAPKGLDVVKHLTLHDFASRMPAQYTSDTNLPLGEKNKMWISKVWMFIVEEVETKYQMEPSDNNAVKKSHLREFRHDCDWKEAKKHVVDVLGEKTIYPVKGNGTELLISVKDASLALFVKLSDDDFYRKMRVLHPLIPDFVPERLNLSATLDDPVSVLDVMYHWKNDQHGISCFYTLICYFGEHCEEAKLSVQKLKSLKIYKDVSGCLQTLENSFIVATEKVHKLNSCHCLSKNTNTVILEASSERERTLFKYINPDCVMSDLELYSSLILPNLSLIPEKKFIELLRFLRDKLSSLIYKAKEDWSHEERNVVSELIKTPFITLNEEMVTANKFYDPTDPVFKAMIPNSLPEMWATREWHSFLCLAGMIHKVSGTLFVQFAQNLSIRDPCVEKKSKVLVQCLRKHFQGSPVEGLDSMLDKVKEIEFLVPKWCPEYEKIHPHYKTNSGLVSFKLSAQTHHMDLLWTTMSILPNYANSLTNDLRISKDISDDSLFLHICNITSVKSTDSLLCSIMESIYGYLESMNSNRFLKRISENCVPIVHLDEKQKFVDVKLVVMNIMEEIEPYLYKAPVHYGRYFTLFEKLGVCATPNCDHFVRVLNMIHKISQGKKLGPEESRCMKLSMTYLAENIIKLHQIQEPVLYLPSKNDKLVKSSEMYVADNSDYERLTVKKLDKPVFVGLSTLKLSKSDEDFMKNLPDVLKPKFLSEVVEECFDESEYEEIKIPEVEKIVHFISSRSFRQGVLRTMKHYGLHSPGTVDEIEREIENKFICVEVKALKKIKVILKLVNGDILGKRDIAVHSKEREDDKVQSFTLYITEKTDVALIHEELSSIYEKMLGITDIEEYKTLRGVFEFMEEPQGIRGYLDSKNIRSFGENEDKHEFFLTDVGSYLEHEFIELLDNNIYVFHNEEIVAMKKYIEGEIESAEDNLYILVQVKELVTAAPEIMNNEYKVYTGDSAKPYEIVKAHMLYKFVREHPQTDFNASKSDNVECDTSVNRLELVPREADDNEEELSEEEIMKTIRKQVKDIWKVNNDHERRHLLRRLLLKWHPDKNRDKQELCTRIVQYIQSLVKRLEKGETIPDDDDHAASTREQPSDFYQSAFRPPPSFNMNNCRGRGQRPRSRERTKMGDRPEAKKWMKQAEHDYSEASECNRESSCWIVFICYQACEKVLKAALYAEDCEQARRVHTSLEAHSLRRILNYISSPILRNVRTLVSDIENRAGYYENMQYPTSEGIPHDRYTTADATFMLEKSRELLDIVKRIF